MLRLWSIAAAAGACLMTSGMASADEKTELHFVVCGDNDAFVYYTNLAKNFESENPDITIDLEVVAWGKCESKTISMAAAGDAPDLAYLGSRNAKQLATNDLILPVKISEAKQALYQPGVLQTVRYKGEFWAYPRAFSTKALYMNCDLFESAGVACVAPKTWDELYTAAKAVKDKLGIGGIGMAGKAADNTYHQFMNYAYSNNAELVNADTGEITFNSKNMLETATFFSKLVDVAQNGPAAHDRANLLDLYNDSKIAMYIEGPWGIKMHTKINNSLIAPLPNGPSGKGGSILISDSIFVFKGTGNEEIAMQLAEAVTDVGEQYIYDGPENLALTPIYQYEQAGIQGTYYSAEKWQPFVAAIAGGGPEPMFIEYKLMQDALVAMVQGIILKDDTPENLVQIAAEELSELE